ncbi:hypothetical protein RhiirA1_427912 [Rhizophagus irregularis]|uniref:Uncharacterized protein n=1 Tax=Rhizophagus irregularis TaxID=588596 RepID=A0A2N0R4G3_9GLOM|nr:hypothetical protein RhiirA1_427912 [Rhizophagus irregularis]
MTIKISSIPHPKENKKNLSKKYQTYTSTLSPYFRRLKFLLTTSTSKKYVGQELLPKNNGPACEPLGQLDFKGIGTKTHYFSTFQKAQGNVHIELPSYIIIGNSKTHDNGPNSI